MKTIKVFSFIIISLLISMTAFAVETVKTEKIKVSGNCEMCESKIEKAAKVLGVIKADWDKGTKILTLVYNPSKVKSADVQKKIAEVGYDTSMFKATAKVYGALPGCCKYR